MHGTAPPNVRPLTSRRLGQLVLVAALGAVLALVPGTPAIADHGRFDRQVRSELQAVLDDYRRSLPVPGVSASVLMPDGTRWSGVSGLAKVGTAARAVTRTTTFVAASITKTFVAALILQLDEEGVVDIDAPLARWMPRYPEADRITLRQLLSHTSGLFDYFDHPDYERLVFGRPRHRWTVKEILALVRPTRAPPGSAYDYSNTNFILLGQVAKRATGSSVGELIRSRFLGPLGLRHTYFQGHDPLSADGAHGYLLAGDRWAGLADGTAYRPNTSAATVAAAAGAMVSTPSDLAVWADALYGGAVLEPASLAEMVYFGDDRYGLGVRRYRLDGRTVWGHSGSLRGFVAQLWYLPQYDVTIVAAMNRGRIDPEVIAGRLGRVILRHFFPTGTTSTSWQAGATSILAAAGTR
jgi:D-alanyl-D-alanine carboxypeptidase